MGQITVRFGPEDVGELLLGDILPAQGDQRFEQHKGFLLHLSREEHWFPVADQFEPPERVDP